MKVQGCYIHRAWWSSSKHNYNGTWSKIESPYPPQVRVNISMYSITSLSLECLNFRNFCCQILRNILSTIDHILNDIIWHIAFRSIHSNVLSIDCSNTMRFSYGNTCLMGFRCVVRWVLINQIFNGHSFGSCATLDCFRSITTWGFGCSAGGRCLFPLNPLRSAGDCFVSTAQSGAINWFRPWSLCGSRSRGPECNSRSEHPLGWDASCNALDNHLPLSCILSALHGLLQGNLRSSGIDLGGDSSCCSCWIHLVLVFLVVLSVGCVEERLTIFSELVGFGNTRLRTVSGLSYGNIQSKSTLPSWWQQRQQEYWF